MKRITLAWALTLCSFITFIACSSPDVGERSVSIIPAPAQMTVGEGTFTIHPGIEIGYADESLKGMRSEERRVGKECRSRWSPYH